MTLEELFALVFDVPAPGLSEASSQKNMPQWDSLKHIDLILALEETYAVSFSTEEILALKSLGDARRLLRAKGAPA